MISTRGKKGTKKHVHRYEGLNVEPPLLEGIVISYLGNTYKLTGAFPSMNRICGAVRYPLGIEYSETSYQILKNTLHLNTYKQIK